MSQAQLQDPAPLPGQAENDCPKSPWKPIAKGVCFLVGLAAAGYVVRLLAPAFSEDWIDTTVRGHGLLGGVVFVAASAVFTGVGLPRQMAGFLGGYAYGFVLGSALGLLGTVLGCVLAFGYARFAGRSVLARRMAGRGGRLGAGLAHVDGLLVRDPFGAAVLLRFLPVGNNMLTNLLAGVSSVPLVPFAAGSSLGYLPQTAIFALLGSGVHVAPEWRITLAVVLFVVSSWYGYVLLKRHRAMCRQEQG